MEAALPIFAFALGLPTLDRQGGLHRLLLSRAGEVPRTQLWTKPSAPSFGPAPPWSPPESRPHLRAGQPTSVGAAAGGGPESDGGAAAHRCAPSSSTAEAFLKLHLLSHRLAPAQYDESGGHLRPSAHRRLDHRRRRGAARNWPPSSCAAASRARHFEVSGGGQVSEDGELRGAQRRAHRGLQPQYVWAPTSAKAPPSMPSGAVNFKRRGLGPQHGGGPHIPRGRGGRRLRPRRRRQHHGAPWPAGGEIKISIGRHCLIGANGGTGIPLGDRCNH